MTYDPANPSSSSGDEPPRPDEGFSDEHEAAGPNGQESPSQTGRDWMSQLQSMIDNLTTQAAPVMREIGAKAAELAAVAGEKAGPIAHRAAEATEKAGVRVAERGREVAADLRRDKPSSSETGMEPGPGSESSPRDGRPGMESDSADSLGE